MECKHCHSCEVVKNGTQDGKQRYKCKNCGKVFRDSPPKHSLEVKMAAIRMHVNCVGNRAAGRILGVHHSVIGYWIKKMGQSIKEIFHQKIEEIQDKDIRILEEDELFTYVKKKTTKPTFLLLLTETTVDLLIFK
jgi:transposase-like protein